MSQKRQKTRRIRIAEVRTEDGALTWVRIGGLWYSVETLGKPQSNDVRAPHRRTVRIECYQVNITDPGGKKARREIFQNMGTGKWYLVEPVK